MNRLYTLFLILCLLMCATVQVVSAETWIEDFSENELDSWKGHEDRCHWGTWQVRDGYLNFQYNKPLGPLIFLYRCRIEFTGFPLQAKQLRVKLTVLETQDARVGIFIGQFKNERTYKFFHNNKWLPNSIEVPKGVPNQKPNIVYNDLKDIEIVFDNGHFELLSEEKRILEFDEPNLLHIDYLGIITYTDQKRFANILVDNFIISAPTFYDVRPKGKATVVWGKLKQQ